jgi:5-methylcytosine-specific restriction endonuclease McrA
VAGERPHLTVTVDVRDLLGDAGAAEFDHTGPVALSIAERLGCDSSVTRVVMNGASQPLDVGRRTPVIPPAMRRAVMVRDRGCRFPGCGRPRAWCDAHHVVHWARGGPTAVNNLVLLCRRHHRLVHGGFGVEMVDGRPVFRRPDGSLVEDRAPP